VATDGDNAKIGLSSSIKAAPAQPDTTTEVKYPNKGKEHRKPKKRKKQSGRSRKGNTGGKSPSPSQEQDASSSSFDSFSLDSDVQHQSYPLNTEYGHSQGGGYGYAAISPADLMASTQQGLGGSPFMMQQRGGAESGGWVDDYYGGGGYSEEEQQQLAYLMDVAALEELAMAMQSDERGGAGHPLAQHDEEPPDADILHLLEDPVHAAATIVDKRCGTHV
jgi:hypothetical protein